MADATGASTPDDLDLAKQDPLQFLGPKGVIRYYTNPRQLLLCAYFWPATTKEVKGTVLLTHGHGGYLCFDFLKFQGVRKFNTYAGSWVEQLNSAGYSVCGIDNQGAGRSEGIRCYAESFDDYVGDVVQFAKLFPTWRIDGFSAGSPTFLLGGSMGGCLAVTAGVKASDLFAGLILLAPMLSLDKVAKRGWNPYLRPLGSWVSYLAPTLPVAAASHNTMYPELQEAWDKDPHTYSGLTRARLAMEFLTATEWLGRNLPAVTLPFIVFHSEDDDQCDVEGSKGLYLHSKSYDKTLRLVSPMWHMLVKEPGNEKILEEVIQWLGVRCAPKPAE